MNTFPKVENQRIYDLVGVYATPGIYFCEEYNTDHRIVSFGNNFAILILSGGYAKLGWSVQDIGISKWKFVKLEEKIEFKFQKLS